MAEVFAIHSPRSGQSSKEAPVSHEEEGRPATPSGESAETANKSSSTSANTSKNQNDNPTDSTSPMKSPEKQSQSPEMKQSSKKLSFREHLSGEADFLLQRNSSRRALEDFANLLDSLATIEETYASSLQKLVQADHARADISPLDDAYDSVRSMLANRADQGSILADQIRSDVVAMLRGMLGQHAAVHQSVSVDAQRVSRLNGAKRHNYELLKQKYKETSLTAERMLVAAYSGGHSSSASASKSSSSSTSWGSLFPTNGTGSPDPEATTTSPTSRSPTSPTQESTTNAPTTRTSASATPVPGLGRTSTSATASATPVVTVSGLGSSEPSSPPKDAGSPKTGNLLGPGNLLGQKILSNIGLPTTAASASSSSSRPVNYRQEKENQHQGETSLVTSRGKLFDAVKRAYIFEDEFRRVSLEAREAEEVYRAQMAAILDALQDMEEKKLQCFRDASMRLLVYNTSCIRNVQYDIEGIFKSCEDVDSVKDVQNFIRSRVVSPSVEQEGGTKTAVSAWQRLIANDQPLPRFVRYREMVPPLSNDPSSRAPGSASSRLPRRPIDQICGEVQRLRDCIATQWFENGDFSLLRNQEFFAALREEPEFRARIFACIRQQMVNKQCAVWEIGDDHESSLKTKQDEPGQSEYGAVLHHADDVLVEAKNSGTDAGLLSNSSLVLRLFTEIPDLIAERYSESFWDLETAKHFVATCRRVEVTVERPSSSSSSSIVTTGGNSTTKASTPPRRRQRVQEVIYEHSLWGNSRFWETLLSTAVTDAWETWFREMIDRSADLEEKVEDEGIFREPWEYAPEIVRNVLDVARQMSFFGIPGGEIRAAVEKVVTSQCDHLAAPVLERLLTHLDMTLTEAVAPSSTLSPFSTTGGSVLLNSESEQEPSAVVQQA